MVQQPALSSLQITMIDRMKEMGVRFIVIGGQAVRANGVDRPTCDLDIVLDPSPTSLQGLAALFLSYGPPPTGLTWLDVLSMPDVLFSFPSKQEKEIDMFTSIAGLDFNNCMQRSAAVCFGEQEMQVAA